MKQLSLEEEEILKLLPNEPFMAREVKSDRGNVKIAFILRSLEGKGLVKRKGKTGKLKRYILWKKN